MAEPRGFVEIASGASGIMTAFASVPSGADNAIIRVDTGTVRWSETGGSYLTASTGLLLASVDPAFRVGGPHGLSPFRFYPMGGGAQISAAYYTYKGIGQFL